MRSLIVLFLHVIFLRKKNSQVQKQTDLHEHDAGEDPPYGREAVAAGALTAAMHVDPAHQVTQVVPNHKEQLLRPGTVTRNSTGI